MLLLYFLVAINHIKLNQLLLTGRATDHQACCSLRKNHSSAFVLHSRLQIQIHLLAIHLEASSFLAGSVREIEFYFRLSADTRSRNCRVPVWLTLGMHSWASHLPISAAEVLASADVCHERPTMGATASSVCMHSCGEAYVIVQVLERKRVYAMKEQTVLNLLCLFCSFDE